MEGSVCHGPDADSLVFERSSNAGVLAGASDQVARALRTDAGRTLVRPFRENLVSIRIDVDAVTTVFGRALERAAQTDAARGGVVQETLADIVRHNTFEIEGADPVRGTEKRVRYRTSPQRS